ncbi:MAG: hypothetical protein OEW37_03995 [Rhodospirillaceae bacterium]|nr:hypothetical protein [Rhodospirillaceae bacterium]
MDFSLNNLSLNNAVKPQKPAAKSEVAAVRPIGQQHGETPQPNTTQSSPPLSVVTTLISSVAIINEEQITEISPVKRRDKGSHAPEIIPAHPPIGNTDNNFGANDAIADSKISEINSHSVREKSSDDTRAATQSLSADEVKRGVNAYQAAGAAFGIGLTKNSFDSGPTVFSPQNIIPIDIKV